MKLIVLASLVVESWSVILGPLGLGAAPATAVVAQTTATAGTAATGATAGTAVAVAVPGGTTASGAVGAGTLGATVAAKALSALANPAVAVTLGLVTVGAEGDASAVTWDCWKPILRENSTAPSRGRPLIDILNDPAISDYSVGNHSVIVRNRWNEAWRIDPLVLPWGEVAAHASQVASSPSELSSDSAFSSMNLNEVLKQQILVSGNLLHLK